MATTDSTTVSNIKRHNYKSEPAISPIDTLPFVVHQKQGKDPIGSIRHVEPADAWG